jgi:predicted RNA-binding Zn ribbon-like protein
VFRWLGMPLALDLANTVMVVREGAEVVDLLATAADLDRWLKAERQRLGDCAFALAHLKEIRAFRDAVRSLLEASADERPLPPEALERVNAATMAAPIAAQIMTRSDGKLHVVEQAVTGDPLHALLGTLARSVIAILTGTERERLKTCRAPSCGMFFLGDRRWCTSMCGNRARAARHYRRIAAK